MFVRVFLSMLCVFSLLTASSAYAGHTGEVVVTIKPLHSLVSAVMGKSGRPVLLLDGAQSPHDFQLKPSQMRALVVARVIFYVDDHLETFLPHAFEALPQGVRTVPVMRGPGVRVLPYRTGGAWEVDTHDDHQGRGHDTHDHDMHDHDAHEHGGDDGKDRHIWLDVKNAIAMLSTISKTLTALYPENQALYRANTEAMVAKLQGLDRALRVDLSSVAGRPFIVFHDAYQYFEKAYGLTGVGSITLDPSIAPSPKRLRKIREKMKDTGAVCVFREPQFSDRFVRVVLEGTGASTHALDPLGADLKPGAGLYEQLLRRISAAFKECLGAR